MSIIARTLKYMWLILKHYALLPIALVRYRGREIWIVSERGTDARDNGFHFFQYLRNQHPEIEAYYVISKDSIDGRRLGHLGNVVTYGSLDHYLLFLAAKFRISTHIGGYAPDSYVYWRFKKLLYQRGKRIFLQHGIIKDNIDGLYKENTKVDLFICGAKPEYDYVAQYFHYHDEVKYTGLARFDALHDGETQDQILVMPTWRMYYSGLDEQELKISDYVIKWNAVLHDERLIAALKRAGKTLVFYPHYEVQKHFLHLFSANDPSVMIADFDHYDVQQLLKDAQLLVTDYSSVYFDFAYMRKPCVYYQFDEAQFFDLHYKPGYFNCREMGFGEVITQHEALVDTLISYLEQDCRMKDVYLKRIDGFFPLHDTQNCERIFAEIQKLKK